MASGITTGTNGKYDFKGGGGLPAGNYQVGFANSCPGNPSNYAPQWWRNAALAGPRHHAPAEAGAARHDLGEAVVPGAFGSAERQPGFRFAWSGHQRYRRGAGAGRVDRRHRDRYRREQARANPVSAPLSGGFLMVFGSSGPPNQHGSYRLDGLPPGAYLVQFSACYGGGYATQWYRHERRGGDDHRLLARRHGNRRQRHFAPVGCRTGVMPGPS